MSKLSKRMANIKSSFDSLKYYSLKEAVLLIKSLSTVSFDQTVDVAVKLGVDPRKSDQNVRGTVSLPNGLGKNIVVLAFAKGDKAKEALAAGADFVGFEEYFEKVKSGWTDFDAVVATPDLMREVGKLGKVLGPRNLMPTPRVGTVTEDLSSIIPKLKAGQIEFKVDRYGVVNAGIAKLSFDNDKIEENLKAFVNAVSKSRPSTAKGVFMQKLYLSSTMGPGLAIDLKSLGLN